jgi:hypothetical protein
LVNFRFAKLERMKLLRRLLVVVFCGPLIISSCFNPPEYPDSPEIVFKSVDYIKGGPLPDGSQAADSIILKLSFKDGDGDVGIGSNELAPPFNDRWYYTKARLSPDNSIQPGYDCSSYNNKCYYIDGRPAEITKFVDYADRSKTTGYDTLKPYIKPFNCTNWEVIYVDDDNDPQTATVPYDTLFFVLNPHYNNLFVEFQMKTDDPANPFDTFDEKQFFTAPSCGIRSFYGRIPILSEDLRRSTPLEGEIRYAIPSLFFKTIFGAKTLRLRVYIEDRALHQSNVVFTREFNLREN